MSNEEKNAVILDNGKLALLNENDRIKGVDHHCGQRLVESGRCLVISAGKESRLRRFMRNNGTVKTYGVLIMD